MTGGSTARRGCAGVAVATVVLTVGLAPGSAAAAVPVHPAPTGAVAQPAAAPSTTTVDSAGFAWESVFTGPGLSDAVTAVTTWDDGTGPALYIAGGFDTAGDRVVNRIARWDGTGWSALTGPSGTGVSGDVAALTVYDGDLIVGGSFLTAGGVTVNHIARWDGTSWSALAGPGGVGVSGGLGTGVFALEVVDGDLIVGGAFTQAGGVTVNHVARWDGTTWSALPGGSAPGVGHSFVPPAVMALHEFDGDLIVGGRFTQAGGQPASGIAAWRDGTWSTLGDGVGGTSVPSVSALTVLDGTLVAAGQFPEAGGTVVDNVATWDGTAWSPLTGSAGTGTDRFVETLAVFDGDLIVGGPFRTAGGREVNSVARWDGEDWFPLSGPDGVGVDTGAPSVVALEVFDGALVAGGWFDTAGGVVVNHVARWDGTTWSPLAATGAAGLSGFVPNVSALVVYEGELVVGGSFTVAGTVTAGRVARWDGQRWKPLGDGFDDFKVRTLVVYEGDLIAGGAFTRAGGVEVNRIARWDGQQWVPMPGPSGTGMSGEVIALAVYDGELIAGGQFTHAGGVQVNGIARWDGTSWSPLGGSAANGTDGWVRSLVVHNGELIAGGQFTHAGGVEVNGIARWDGTSWSPLPGPAGVGVSGQVDALAEYGGDLIAGGGFSQAGGEPASGVARWDGTQWSPLGGGVDGLVSAFATFGGDLIAAGLFTHAGVVPASRVARWDGTSWSPLEGPAGNGADDWVTALLTADLDGAGPQPEKLYAGGWFTATGGVANWYLGVYGPRELTTSPDPLDFGEVATGTTAGPLSLTLANTGTRDLAVSGVTAPTAPFAAAGGTCGAAPFTLGAGASCTLDYTFSPTVDGPAMATVTVTSDARTSPDAVTLRGTGTPPVPRLTVDPDRLEPVVTLGGTETLTVTVANPGDAPLHWQVVEGRQVEAVVTPPDGGGTTVPTTPVPDDVHGFGHAPAAPDGAGSPPAPAASASDPRPTSAPASDPRPTSAPASGPAPAPAEPGITITHSASQDITPGNTVACLSSVTTTAENHYLRTFTLPDFGITDDFHVREVTFGVESLTATALITVNLYTLDGELRFDNLTPIGSRTEQLTFQALTMVTVPVRGTAPAGSTLVVEIAAPDLTGQGAFFPGSNPAGESGPSYVAAPDCGAPEPITYESLGVTGVHLVMTVTGRKPVECDLPQWLGVEPRGGTVAAGDSQGVPVDVDTTGLTPGTYEANLCLASDDPDRSLVVVPVVLTVEATPLTLSARTVFAHGQFTAELTWPETGPGQVDIHRDGTLIATVDNDGAYADPLGRPRDGTRFVYRICHAGTEACSDEVPVVADRRGGPLRPLGLPPASLT